MRNQLGGRFKTRLFSSRLRLLIAGVHALLFAGTFLTWSLLARAIVTSTVFTRAIITRAVITGPFFAGTLGARAILG